MGDYDAYGVPAPVAEAPPRPTSPGQSEEGYKLFVGNLSFRTESAALREAFEPFGRIVFSTVIENRETGQSRGFGFVVYEQKHEADAAISRMDNAELDGRTLRVNFARPREEFGGRRGGGRGGYEGRDHNASCSRTINKDIRKEWKLRKRWKDKCQHTTTKHHRDTTAEGGQEGGREEGRRGVGRKERMMEGEGESRVEMRMTMRISFSSGEK
ncbi:31 kda ribonucleoprotein [Nannochloropsis gaditana]|uniref:31 kDa ribonucleoprotein n=1 Tax=Nannochloropsis gaditana TaxID=72520 RepID=W7TF23_9STRA|nr:31 kda ribonucleoprotein [Nannochloropsis gaditana]